MVAVTVPALWVLFQLANHAVALNCRQAKPCAVASFTGALPAGAYVERVLSVPGGGSYGEGASNLGYPGNAQNLPAVCAVTVRVVSGQSRYRFGLFLPVATEWNSKFLAVGSYSQAGGINWPDMGQGPHYGMATMSSDLGHNSTGADLSWATPDTLLDWGYRALNGSVFLAKTLTQAYYGKRISYSYWTRNPSTGALIGAAAWDTKHLFPWLTKIGTYNLATSDPKHIDVQQFALLSQTVQSQCDRQDGNTDGIVSSPDTCRLDLTAIQCGDPRASPTNCLTAPQIQTVKNIYSDYVIGAGKFVHHGFSPSSEAQWSTFLSFGAPEDFDVRYERYWLYNDTSWNWTQYTDAVVDDSEGINPGMATADAYDISAFKKRGGKVLMYHGLADGVVPAKSSGLYYNRTVAAMGGSDLRDFFRLFYVPGMQHCWFTPPEVDAPWAFGGAGQATQLLAQAGFGQGWSTPGYLGDPKYDALAALMNWVEKGAAVNSVVATTWRSTGNVARQRPLCPWPKSTVYKGIGSKNDTGNWNCA